jgi:hypothetical protein
MGPSGPTGPRGLATLPIVELNAVANPSRLITLGSDAISAYYSSTNNGSNWTTTVPPSSVPITPKAVDYTGDFVVVVGYSTTNPVRIFSKASGTWIVGPTPVPFTSGEYRLIGVSRIGNDYAVIDTQNKIAKLIYTPATSEWSWSPLVSLPNISETATGIATNGEYWVISGSITSVWFTTGTSITTIQHRSPLTVGNGDISGIFFDGLFTGHFHLLRKNITRTATTPPFYLSNIINIGNAEEGFIATRNAYKIQILNYDGNLETLDVLSVNNIVVNNSTLQYTPPFIGAILPSTGRIWTSILITDEDFLTPVEHPDLTGNPILAQDLNNFYLASQDVVNRIERNEGLAGTTVLTVSTGYYPGIIAVYSTLSTTRDQPLANGDKYKTYITNFPITSLNFTTGSLTPTGDLATNFMIYVKNGSRSSNLAVSSNSTLGVTIPPSVQGGVSPLAIGHFSGSGLNFY